MNGSCGNFQKLLFYVMTSCFMVLHIQLEDVRRLYEGNCMFSVRPLIILENAELCQRKPDLDVSHSFYCNPACN